MLWPAYCGLHEAVAALDPDAPIGVECGELLGEALEKSMSQMMNGGICNCYPRLGADLDSLHHEERVASGRHRLA